MKESHESEGERDTGDAARGAEDRDLDEGETCEAETGSAERAANRHLLHASRFAGEQQVSTALVTLTSKEKKKVAFVRSGGLMRARRREIDRLEREAKDARERRLGVGSSLEGAAGGPSSLGDLFDDLLRLFDRPGL